MHRARIAAGADNLRSGRGGPLARLFISPLNLFAAFSMAGCLVSLPAEASEDPLETLLDADYARQLLPGSEPPPAIPGSLPGFPEAEAASIPEASAPRFSAAAAWRQRNLISSEGGPADAFGFSHRSSLATIDLSTAAIPGLEYRFAADRVWREMRLGDSAASVGMGDTGWAWRAAATFRFTRWLVPSLIVGGESSTPHGSSLEAISLAGSMPFGLEWSAAMGRRQTDFPVRLRLKDYAPLTLPLQARQRFMEAAMRMHSGPWEAYWSGNRMSSDFPRVPPQGYALGDSGSAWRQRVQAGYSRLRPHGGWKASLDFNIGAGEHVFRGRNRRDGNAYPFSWQEGIRKDYSLRADLRFGGGSLPHGILSRWGTSGGTGDNGAWDYGTWLAAGESEYNALRPAIPFNRHLWNRNGVIDSYEGSVLNIFNNETWLLNGATYAAQAAAGAWIGFPLWGWRHRCAAGYRYLLLEANSRLTRRETNFILTFTEETLEKNYPTVEADLIPVEWRLTRAWGSFSLDMDVRAEIPARVHIRKADPSAGESGSNGGSGYSGGTVAGLRVGYILP